MSYQVASLSGCTVYNIAPWLMKKLGGPMNASCVSWFIMGFRVLSIAYLCRMNPYLFLIPELFQGLTYSLFWLSSVEHVDRTSHPSILTTMCGVLNR